jgi:hypothetical protein
MRVAGPPGRSSVGTTPAAWLGCSRLVGGITGWIKELAAMDIIQELIKFLIIPALIIIIPILFILVLDIAAHLGELFGQR